MTATNACLLGTSQILHCAIWKYSQSTKYKSLLFQRNLEITLLQKPSKLMKEVTFYHVTQRNGFFFFMFCYSTNTLRNVNVFGPGTNEEGVTLYDVTQCYIFFISCHVFAQTMTSTSVLSYFMFTFPCHTTTMSYISHCVTLIWGYRLYGLSCIFSVLSLY